MGSETTVRPSNSWLASNLGTSKSNPKGWEQAEEHHRECNVALLPLFLHPLPFSPVAFSHVAMLLNACASDDDAPTTFLVVWFVAVAA